MTKKLIISPKINVSKNFQNKVANKFTINPFKIAITAPIKALQISKRFDPNGLDKLLAEFEMELSIQVNFLIEDDEKELQEYNDFSSAYDILRENK